MKFPAFIASKPADVIGSARANPAAQTDTGPGAFGAIQQLGQNIQQVGALAGQAAQKRKALDEKVAWGNALNNTEDVATQLETEAEATNYTENKARPGSPEELKQKPVMSMSVVADANSDMMKRYDEGVAFIRSSFDEGSDQQRLYDVHAESQRIAFAERIDSINRSKLNAFQEESMTVRANKLYRDGLIAEADSLVQEMLKNGLIGEKDADKLIRDGLEAAVTEEVTDLYRIGEHDEARKVLEASPLSDVEKEKLEDVIDKDELTVISDFQDSVNQNLVNIDSTENMTQAEFNAAAEAEKRKILAFDKIDGTKRKQMLADLERWRRGTNEIDFAKINSLNQELDSVQRTGRVDPTLEGRIRDANLAGSFGGRNKGGNKTYGDMIRRLQRLEFDGKLQIIAPVVNATEKILKDDPDILFLFNQAKAQFLEDNKDLAPRELFTRMSALAESYENIHPALVRFQLRKQKEKEPATWKSGDTRTVNGVTYTFDGTKWTD